MGKLELTTRIKKEMRGFLASLVLRFPSSLPTLNIPDLAEKVRVLPPGTPRPGPLDLTYTEYLREPLENMSPQSTIQRSSTLKGAQLGYTMAMECIICYYIGYDHADQLVISATDASIDKWATRRLEPAIDSYGYREIIRNNENTGRRSGDKQFSKSYFGMQLDMASAQAPASLRSSDKRILLRDEIDGAPAKLKTGEGNWIDVSYARTNSWGDRRKVWDISTPTTFEKSQIWIAYLEGDQRKFEVPCPHCKEFIVLEFKYLVAERKGRQVIDVFYGCQKCGEAIYNYHKNIMIPYGKWIPTAVSTSKFQRSYHISSMYSPVGMVSWTELVEHHDKAERSIDPEKMKTFVNLYLGMPFKEKGTKPTLEKVLSLRGTYNRGTVPDMALFLTIGIDVQRGSEKDKENPARLELEILAHGPGYRTYSVDYLRFEGAVDDAFSGAWEDLNDWALSNKLKFYKKNNSSLSVQMVFIDSGDGETTDVVYQFSSRWNSCFPIKGFRVLKDKEGVDKAMASDFRRYKRSRVGEDIHLFSISTNYYKNRIYNNLKIRRKETDELQRPGFCDFPMEYDEKYFKMLTAEEKRADGHFYISNGKRNESLDCRCYALCAADVYLDALVDRFRKALKERNATEQEIKSINTRFVIEHLKKELGVVDDA